ncbi:hypothetical protein IU487_33745 [Nocardia puris]|uniref:hypothetical protein n=1 Tax=Nocardia puris TaxID=208602 RepID=UPI001894199A|nr:hypothetical protein [Nocardia puris]MBF6215965.1 hypothetical protein [Nocardia puris]
MDYRTRNKLTETTLRQRTPAPAERIMSRCVELLDVLDDLDELGESLDPTITVGARLAAHQALRILLRSEDDPATRAKYHSLSNRCRPDTSDLRSNPRLHRYQLGAELDARLDDPATSGEIELARRIIELHDGTDPPGLMTDLAKLAAAYTRADQHDNAHHVLADLRTLAHAQPHLSAGTPDELLNIAMRLLAPMLYSLPPQQLSLVRELLATAALFRLDDYDRFRHLVATGVLFTAEGDMTAAHHLNTLLTEQDPPARPNHVRSTTPVLMLRHLLAYRIECTTTTLTPLVAMTRHVKVGRGGSAGHPPTTYAILAVSDNDYQAVRLRVPTGTRTTITVRSADNGTPLFMVLRPPTGPPLCAIAPIAEHQAYLRTRQFHAVVITPLSRTTIGDETGAVQRITEGITAIVEQ